MIKFQRMTRALLKCVAAVFCVRPPASRPWRYGWQAPQRQGGVDALLLLG